MKRMFASLLSAILLTGAASTVAQTSFPPAPAADAPIPVTHVAKAKAKTDEPAGPLSRWAVGAGVSPLGINLLVATNLNRFMDVRATGNVFRYTVNDISSEGFNIDAKLDLASAGASVDFYPFVRYLRLSPGVLFYNDNYVTGTALASAGTSFTLNDVTYYSSKSDPVTGKISLGLHEQNPAFTITAGTGRIVGRTRHHLSFPFEVGVALIGAPKMGMTLTGQACDSQGQNCVNVATDPTVQANLKDQIQKYNNDIEELKFYPIVRFGIAYSFAVR